MKFKDFLHCKNEEYYGGSLLSVLKLIKALLCVLKNSLACFANFIHFLFNKLVFDLSSDNISALDLIFKKYDFLGGRTTPIITLKMHNVADQFEKYKLTQKCKFIPSIQIK